MQSFPADAVRYEKQTRLSCHNRVSVAAISRWWGQDVVSVRSLTSPAMRAAITTTLEYCKGAFDGLTMFDTRLRGRFLITKQAKKGRLARAQSSFFPNEQCRRIYRSYFAVSWVIEPHKGHREETKKMSRILFKTWSRTTLLSPWATHRGRSQMSAS